MDSRRVISVVNRKQINVNVCHARTFVLKFLTFACQRSKRLFVTNRVSH